MANIVVFDADDIGYLINNFSIDQLRHEISNCFKRLNGENDWKWRAYYNDFIESCQLAIHIIEWYEPKPISQSNIKTPKESIESIKSRYDLVEYIGCSVRLKKSGANFQGLCPFHSEKKGSFFVYPKSQTWHCFGACNKGGDLISFVMAYDHVDIKGAINKLAR